MRLQLLLLAAALLALPPPCAHAGPPPPPPTPTPAADEFPEESPGEERPAFPAQGTALLAAAGGAATLRCAVLHLGHKAVSWVRSRDLQILSHAGAVFTADRRAAAAERRAGARSEHELTLAPLRRADAGRYECQVNTEPKMSLFFNLTVLDALPTVRVWIEEGAALTARAGGGVTLTCEARLDAANTVDSGVAPPLDLVWEKDGQPITFQSSAGGVLLERWRWAGGARAALRLAAAARRDAGQYTCAGAAPPLPPAAAATDLVVITSDTGFVMEAMQRDDAQAGGGGGGGGGGAGGGLAPLLAAAAAALLLPLLM